MSSMKLRSLLGSILLGAGLFTAAATSNAAVFRGNWDPSFGDPYPNLGYRGFADFFVPDECLATDGWFSDVECDASLLAAAGLVTIAGCQGRIFEDTGAPSSPVEVGSGAGGALPGSGGSTTTASGGTGSVTSSGDHSCSSSRRSAR